MYLHCFIDVRLFIYAYVCRVILSISPSVRAVLCIGTTILVEANGRVKPCHKLDCVSIDGARYDINLDAHAGAALASSRSLFVCLLGNLCSIAATFSFISLVRDKPAVRKLVSTACLPPPYPILILKTRASISKNYRRTRPSYDPSPKETGSPTLTLLTKSSSMPRSSAGAISQGGRCSILFSKATAGVQR